MPDAIPLSSTINVALVEDQNTIRNAISSLINSTDTLSCVATFPNAEAALAALPSCDVHVVLMDIGLPGMSGIECIRQLRERGFTAECIMMTVFEDYDSIFHAIEAGANGYLLKNASSEKIIESIEEVFKGGSAMSSPIARQVVQAFREMGKRKRLSDDLTPREREVLEKLIQGFQYQEIANDLFLSVDTVRSHIHKIYKKLQVNSRKALMEQYTDLQS